MVIIALLEQHYNNPNHTSQLCPRIGPKPMNKHAKVYEQYSICELLNFAFGNLHCELTNPSCINVHLIVS